MMVRWATHRIPDRPQRRRFTADYKLAILADYDRLTARRRQGRLVAPGGPVHLAHRGVAPGPGGGDVAAHRRATPAAAAKPAGDAAALAKATRRAERAEAELAKTRMALEIMGKAHALLEMLGRERGLRLEAEELIAGDGGRTGTAGRGPPGVPC